MIKIVADTGAHLPPAVRAQFGIESIPLVVIFGARAYKDEVELSNEEFYEMLRREKVHPTTSAPAPADFIAVWRPIIEAGDEVVTLLLPREISATYSSGLAAKAQFEAEKGHELPITVVDSKLISMGMGFEAIAGARAARAGKTRAEVAGAMEEVGNKITLIFLLDTLEYLRRGGRIGNATALLGSLFSFKPLLQFKEGRIEPLERARSRKSGLNRLIQLVAEPPGQQSKPVGSAPLHLSILHAAASTDADYVENELRARYNLAEFYTAHIGPVIATHSGPQAVGIAFYRE